MPCERSKCTTVKMQTKCTKNHPPHKSLHVSSKSHLIVFNHTLYMYTIHILSLYCCVHTLHRYCIGHFKTSLSPTIGPNFKFSPSVFPFPFPRDDFKKNKIVDVPSWDRTTGFKNEVALLNTFGDICPETIHKEKTIWLQIVL